MKFSIKKKNINTNTKTKNWQYVAVAISVLLIIYFIYKRNYEKFEMPHEGLKESIASYLNVHPDRIDNLSVSGSEPDTTIKFVVLPRESGDTQEPKLDEIEQTLKAPFDTIFNVNGSDQRFVHVQTKSIKKDPMQIADVGNLKQLFTDSNLNKQIRELKNIRDLVKYNANTNHFLEFNDLGNLRIQPNPEFEDAQDIMASNSFTSDELNTMNTKKNSSTNSTGFQSNNINSIPPIEQ